jgi:hypothetical protein
MKRIVLILAIILVLLVTGLLQAQAALSVVQSTVYAVSSTSSSVSFTLATTPTPGNILVAFTCIVGSQNPTAISAPDGTWTLINTYQDTGGYNLLNSYWHPVVSGNGRTYTFPCSGGGAGTSSMSGVLYEITGASTTTPINQQATYTPGETTASVIPSVIGTLPIAAMCSQNGSTSGVSAGSISSGWTLDQYGIPHVHSIFAGHRNSLTTDTTTSISATFTATNTASQALTILLIAPGVTPTRHGTMIPWFRR